MSRELPSSIDVLIVGGGLHGLATAYHVSRLGARSVAVIEQFSLGHKRGSSHGTSRITRSSYSDVAYAELMTTAYAEEWPRLERDSGRKLIHACPGCFFGPESGPFANFLNVANQLEVKRVERITLREAERRFPIFRFDAGDAVLHDHTAGVIDAAGVLDCLTTLCRSQNVMIHEGTEVLSLDMTGDPLRVETTKGRILAERCVITAGPWIGKLVPKLQRQLAPIRQTVGYFRMALREADVTFPRFPVWICDEPQPGGAWYGLPQFGNEGIKVARHLLYGDRADPDQKAEVKDEDIRQIREFLARRFRIPVSGLVSAETCFYTIAPNEDYVLDSHPENPRITIGAGFSGHGFKLGLVSGRILAELCLFGHSSVESFESRRPKFSCSRNSLESHS